MIPAKTLNSLLPITAAVVCFLFPIFCTGQGSSSSTNPCETLGKCGPFGVCNSQDSPICSCLPGFFPLDSGNWTRGCGRRAPLNCGGGGNSSTNSGRREDGFFKLQIVMLFGYSDRWSGPQDQCKGRCLRNCSCLAYGSDGDSGCRFWTGPLVDIQKFPGGSGSIIYVRVSDSELDVKKGISHILIVIGVASFVIASVGIYISWRLVANHRGKKKTIEHAKEGPYGPIDNSLPDELSHVNLEELPLFTLEIVSNATNNFSEASKLGKGGFGPVYKGDLADGREIAVKRLSQASTQGMQEFINEVVLISKLQHKNLVRLLGCCVENKETMLIYEYMPNKSLDYYLFDSSQQILDWRKRFIIIEGVCRGLLYLHRDSRLKIIHRDLKPSNILLDNDWNPKISDFGMARIFGAKQDHVSTVRVVGTYGYMAPEYAIEGRFSEKSDVYSLGVLMIEIATGRRNKTSYHDNGASNLLGHVWKAWSEDNVRGVVDSRISSSINWGELMRCMHIGLLCVQAIPTDRPSVSAVLSMLCSEAVELPEPKQSTLAVRAAHLDTPTATTSSQQSHSCSSSVNNLTLSMVDAR